MGSKGWIKRVLPFFATFAVGIFIASFFVSVGPRWGRHGRWKLKAEIERLRTENEELRNENLRLKNDRCEDASAELDYHLKTVLPVNPPIILPHEPKSPPMPHHPPKR